MNKLNKLIYGNDSNIEKKAYLWTILGGGVYSFTSVVLLVLATRVIGEAGAGVFSLAYSTAQMLLTIALFDIRGFQVTDIVEKYTFKDYLLTRIITCFAMMAAVCLFVIFSDYHGGKAVLFIIVALMKMLEAISDVFEGLYQQKGRMDVSGKSVFIKMVFSSSMFAIVLLITHSIYWAVSLDIIVYCTFTFFIDIQLSKCFNTGSRTVSLKKTLTMLIEAAPLFINSFLLLYIYNIPKYSIDRSLSAEFQTYYSVLFMPASIINLLRGFTFKPVLSKLAVHWHERDFKNTVKICRQQIAVIAVISICAIIGGLTVLLPVLSFLYNIDLSSYKLPMLIMLLGGSINAFATMLNYLGVIIRRQKLFLYAYIITTLISSLFSQLLVSRLGLTGAALNYMLSMLILCLCSAIILLLSLKGIKKDWGKKEND